MVASPEEWRWSSYRDMLGERTPPDWLATDALLAQFSSERAEAVRRYVQFVAEGRGAEPIWNNLKRQIYLGDERFVERMQGASEGLSKTIGVPKAQKRPPVLPIDELASKYHNRNKAIAAIHATGEYSYQQIADFYGLHFTTVGKIVRKQRASVMGSTHERDS
jgi:hypothetical protein